MYTVYMMNDIFNANTLVFDMDGTLADFYGVSGWRESLNAKAVDPYVNAKPLVDMMTLRDILIELKAYGIRVIVTSWLAKNTNNEYDRMVRQAKREWLAKYDMPYDNLYLVKYGTDKSDCSIQYGNRQILIDDNPDVRNSWKLGPALNEKEFMDALQELLRAKQLCLAEAS